MIGKDDGWKVYVSIAPWYCGGDDVSDGAFLLRDGLPVLPSRGDYFPLPAEAKDFLADYYGEKPCENCNSRERCLVHDCGKCPIIYTSDCSVVHSINHVYDDKAIVIVLTEEQ